MMNRFRCCQRKRFGAFWCESGPCPLLTGPHWGQEVSDRTLNHVVKVRCVCHLIGKLID